MTYPPPEPNECTPDELIQAIEFYEVLIQDCVANQRIYLDEKMGCAMGEMDWISTQLGYKDRLEEIS